MNRFAYYKPRSLDEALELKEKIPGALFIAGGTDILVKIKDGELRPPALISLRSVPELCGIVDGDATRIGAMNTIRDLTEHPALRHSFPVLVDAALKHSGPQIRNVATIGGNLCNCSPCADTATPLLVLGAKVRIRSAAGSRDIAIEEFFRGPGESCLASGEILTDILLRPPQKKARAAFLKKGRVRMDLAVASVALLLEMDGNRCLKARLAAGSVAPVPLRLPEVEALLEGSAISKEILSQVQEVASESVSPITDVRATEEYRRWIVGVLVRRAIEKSIGKRRR